MTGKMTPEDARDLPDGPNAGTDAEAAADAARLNIEPKTLTPDAPQAIVIPAGAALYEPDLSAWRERPTRKRGCYKPATVDSLTSYTNLYATEATTIWVHPTSGRVVAVIDDHEGASGAPGWGDHRADLSLSHTPEWEYWLGKDNAMMGQEEFALHIEGGLQEIEQPDGATMLEIAQSFHATNGVSFRSATRLASGEQQFLYDEVIEAKAGKSGELQVPTTFVLLLAPFVGEEERQVVARLRYRISGGGLVLGYRLERPDRVVREALDAVAETLAETFPRVFVGEPA